MTFEVWDVVKVPFPYTDRPIRQNRPALVIAAGQITQDYGLLWVAMITSAANRGSQGPHPLESRMRSRCDNTYGNPSFFRNGIAGFKLSLMIRQRQRPETL